MSRWLKCTSMYFNTDWNKYDDRLMKAVERGEVDKVAAVLSKKGIIPTKLDVEGRSAFHLAATRGHLDCLNLILGHNVDLTATDATGKSALHLAARNSQSLCVQKLLQHNCPVGNVDLQGKTALHDAVMAGCSSSVKLLCDSGATVNATDFDGRTPLMLATQMCHPWICQLLLERGGDLTICDKQNKTALILGCEYGCKDAVEVLLKNGADVAVVDGLGHDSYHYARLTKNQELVSLVKSYLDSTHKAKEAARLEQKKRQHLAEANAEAAASRAQIIHDLERQNEHQQESLRKFHLEQRALMDKVNLLQQQLSQEKSAVEDIHNEREHLKLLLSVREKEDVARAMETVKVQHKNHLGDYSGQSVIKGKDNILVKQSHSLDSAQILQPSGPSRSLSRPLELSRSTSVSSEVESLRRELEGVRQRQEVAEEEVSRLKLALVRKSKECEELAQSRDATKRDSDKQVRDLEEALGDVQKRMLESEAKVKQLQAHVVAVKEHLSNQLVDDLKAQLSEVKVKYEGASAEVGRVRNHLKQSEKALEEYKKSEGVLAVEAETMTKEVKRLTEEKENMAATLLEMEAHVKEADAKLAAVVPAEKFDNMKILLTNAVDEKEKQLAELREDYDRVLEEVAELHRELDHKCSPGKSIPLQEHERLRAILEEQSSALKKKLSEVTLKSQDLIMELEEAEDDRELLREQMEELKSKIQTQFVPLKSHEEMKKSFGHTVEELRQQLAEAVEKSIWAEDERQKLQVEKATLCENVTNLKSTHVSCERFESEVGSLSARNTSLEKELESLQKIYTDKEKELRETMKNKQGEFVSRLEYEKMRAELSAALDESKNKVSRMERDCWEMEEELQKVKVESATLREKFEKVQASLDKDYISRSEHEVVKMKLNSTLSEAELKVNEAQSNYQSAQEATVQLHKAIEEQKKELDTIQEAIQSRFVPLHIVQEKEQQIEETVKNLSTKLAEMEENYVNEKKERERHEREKVELKLEVEAVRKGLESDYVSSEKYQEVEEEYKGRVEDLRMKLVTMEQKNQELTVQRDKLEKQIPRQTAEIESLQRCLQAEYVSLEKFQALNLHLHQVKEQYEQAEVARKLEADRVQEVEKELQSRGSSEAAMLAEQVLAREALEVEVVRLRQALRDEEENGVQRAEDIAALQSELLRATQALEKLRSRDDEVAELRVEKQRLEEEVLELSQRLPGLAQQCDELYQDLANAKDSEARTYAEMEALQAKSTSIELEVRDLQERYDDSLSTIGDLQRRIQLSSEQTEVKDKRITELLADVERLKQALNGLSQLAYAGNTPSKRPNQHIDTLQAQVKSLQQQLADAERQHREVVSIYRTHLLSAAQGHMDEDVQAALLQIIRMRQDFVC
uniref:Uveal autoantigen with coiled-coil domains and ankyrin repeats b n=1 Tax=Denticeps clupeoides TaxID=299321 RepID=A0AAY4C0S3_9TELE